MGEYGTAAIEAVRLCRQGLTTSPQDAWEKATSKIFGWGTSSQRKGCPRNAFLGLCEEGLVRGIESGDYTRSQKNKRYAVDAVAILQRHPSLAGNHNRLWSKVLADEQKKHNSQMDVVIALWKAGLIRVK